MFARSLRQVSRVTNSARKLSNYVHNEAEVKAEMDAWLKYSFGEISLWYDKNLPHSQFFIAGVAFCGVMTAYILATDEHVHPERPDLHKFSTKPYPWTCYDCNLFDKACWDECRANRK